MIINISSHNVLKNMLVSFDMNFVTSRQIKTYNEKNVLYDYFFIKKDLCGKN